jgi:hypothetical protein
MAQYFNGSLYIEPGADVVVDFDSTPQVTNLSTSTVLLLGESENGLDYTDKKVYAFTSLADAKSVLKAGKALEVMSCLFNPSSDVRGASKVLFIRTNRAYPAQFKFATGSQLKAARYAVVTVVGATPAGRVGFDISIAGRYPVTVYQDIVTSLSDALEALVAEVNELDGVLASLSGTIVTITATNNAIDFTISNALAPAYTTAETSVTTAYNPTFSDAIVVKTKDKGRNIKYALMLSQGICTFFTDEGILQMMDGITTAQQLADAIANSTVLSKLFVTEVVDGTAVLPSVPAVVPFIVQDNDATTPSSFSHALDLTVGKDKSFVFAAFEEEGYHQLLKNYVVNGSEYGCMAFVGRGLGETPSEVMQAAATLNAEKVVLCYPGCYLNLDGETKLYSPMYFAAICAGLACGLECQTPLTRKLVNVLGFEDIDYEGSSEKAVREELINKGVLFGRYSEDIGYFVNKGINTVQGQVNRQLLETDDRTHEISIARIRIQMQKEIKVSADKTFPGSTRLSPSKTDVESFYAKYFNSKVGTFLTGWDSKSLSVWLQEDAWFGAATVYVNGPINHSFFTLSFMLDNAIE